MERTQWVRSTGFGSDVNESPPVVRGAFAFQKGNFQALLDLIVLQATDQPLMLSCCRNPLKPFSMNYRILIGGVATCVLLFNACNKGTSVGPQLSGGPFRELFDEHVADATQTFTITANAFQQVNGAHGTRVYVQPNAFLYANGSVVTGSVQIQLVEVLTIGDMIWMNKQTVGRDGGQYRLLRSGGEVRLSATQAGQELRVVNGSVRIRIPDATPDNNMRAFSGSEDQAGNMLWDPVDSVTVTLVEDTGSSNVFYQFEFDSLQWINCDYFYNYPSTTGLEATIPTGQPADSTALWVAFPSENAVMAMPATGQQTYETWQVVPVGMNAVIVGLYRNGTQYYSAFETVTIANGMSVPMSFAPTTLAQFELAVNAL